MLGAIRMASVTPTSVPPRGACGRGGDELRKPVRRAAAHGARLAPGVGGDSGSAPGVTCLGEPRQGCELGPVRWQGFSTLRGRGDGRERHRGWSNGAVWLGDCDAGLRMDGAGTCVGISGALENRN